MSAATPPFLPGSVDAEGPWQLIVPGAAWQRLLTQLFQADGDEHAAVLSAGVARTGRGTRLLVRDVLIARDGTDFVPGQRGHRRLTPEFVNEAIRACRDEGLAYLAVHNHGGRDEVAFSTVDMASHERGYPALLDIARGQPVGALVVADNAVAGDIWTPDGLRRPIGETVVLARNRERLYPSPLAAPPGHAAIDDRQARIYGDVGQALLGRLKVGVIGGGGVGMAISAALSRLGVQHQVVVDPDRVDPSNLPRLPETSRLDAMTWLNDPGRPQWLQRRGRRLARPKVAIARRIGRRARHGIFIEGIPTDISEHATAVRLVDCDYLFLAADSHVARAVFNALVHQYLIPGVQVGSKVEVDEDGVVGAISSIVRPVTPDAGCLWCNELIRPHRLTEESLPAQTRRAQRYLPADDAPAPSVITLNALGVAQATNHFMLYVTGLLRPSDSAGEYRRFEGRSEHLRLELPRADPTCPECGLGSASLRAHGDARRLPVREAQ